MVSYGTFFSLFIPFSSDFLAKTMWSIFFDGQYFSKSEVDCITSAFRLQQTIWYLDFVFFYQTNIILRSILPRWLLRALSRLSFHFFKPNPFYCPIPLEYPADYFAMVHAIFNTIEYPFLYRKMAINFKPFFENYLLIPKIVSYEKEYKRIIENPNSQIYVNQWQSVSQYYFWLTIPITFYATFKLTGLELNVDNFLVLVLEKGISYLQGALSWFKPILPTTQSMKK